MCTPRACFVYIWADTRAAAAVHHYIESGSVHDDDLYADTARAYNNNNNNTHVYIYVYYVHIYIYI